jgi:hypothetical protein
LRRLGATLGDSMESRENAPSIPPSDVFLGVPGARGVFLGGQDRSFCPSGNAQSANDLAKGNVQNYLLERPVSHCVSEELAL